MVRGADGAVSNKVGCNQGATNNSAWKQRGVQHRQAHKRLGRWTEIEQEGSLPGLRSWAWVLQDTPTLSDFTQRRDRLRFVFLNDGDKQCDPAELK